jgi:Ca2+-binding EF-hand superfamily protein
MTTISAATSISSYSYSKSSTSASQDTLSCNTVSAKKSTASQQLSEDATNSAEKLMSQLMSSTMNGLAGQSASSEQQDGGADMDVAQLDSDGDGYVSKAEFVAARPSDVSEDEAGTLFNSFDSEGSGSLSVDALTEAMSAQRSERPEGPPPSADDDDDQFASLLSDLDTDGDGLVTLDEFMAGESDDVTESQASQLFSLLDASGTGLLSAQSTS